MTVLITGATGFIGRHLSQALLQKGHAVQVAVRQAGALPPELPHVLLPSALEDAQAWRPVVRGCDTVVHLLARAHVLREHSAEPLAVFRAVNVAATAACAEAAALEGVKRFVFVSSIGVHGQATQDQAYCVTDVPKPHSAYAVSKLEAECVLQDVAAAHGMQWTIVRPPMVYGPNAPGNLSLLMRFLSRGVPLPFAGVTSNRRSFVAVDNLCDLLVRCVDHPAAANQTFLVADGEDLSTADLLKKMGRAIGKPARLFPVPEALLWAAGRALGKQTMVQSVLGSLQVDAEHTRKTLSWQPMLTPEQAFQKFK
jgi:nucleoside-diphosphate-sugar epimerase